MRTKAFYLNLVLILTLLALLAACGDDKGNNSPPSNLEIVTASSQPGVTAGAGAEPTETQASATTVATASTASDAATTASATTAAANASPASATTSSTTASAASPTSAPAKTTAPAPTTAPAKTTVAQAASTPKAASGPAIKKGVLLEPMTWEAQTWNNCAPVSAMMALSYYGLKLTQLECAKALRPASADTPKEPGDKHVQPQELANFIKSKGFKTIIRENGTMNQLRALLSAGVPVITQQWLHEDDDIGHYRVARGFDTATNVIIYNDPYDRKANTVVDADFQDKLWKGYDRRFFPVYTAALEPTVRAILGDDFDAASNMSRATTAAQKYSEKQPKDVDAWRNLGYLYYAAGDYKSAIGVWEDHLRGLLKPTDNGPYNRFLWYQLWPVESYNKLGNYAEVIKIAPNEITRTKIYAEARYEYAYALSNTGRKDEAISQLKKALLDDQNYRPTYDLLAKLGVS